MIFSKRNMIIGIICLFVLNVAAFYILNQSLQKSPSDAAETAASGIWSDIVPAAVLTIDILGLLFTLYLLIKAIIKLLKKSTSSRS